MSNIIKWGVVALIIIALLWVLAGRVGPQDLTQQEMAVDVNAIQ